MKRFFIAIILSCMAMTASVYADIITIDGTVKSVDVGKRTITLDSGAKERTFDVSSKAKIKIGDNEASLETVNVGQKVSLDYHDQLEVVVKIEGSPEVPEAEEEFFLFNGESLENWSFHSLKNRPSTIHKSWVVDSERKVLVCLGNGANWIETKTEYQDFTASLDWRFLPGKTVSPSGSGFVIRSTQGGDPNSLLPVGIEVQIGNGTSGDLWSVGTSLRTERPSPEGGGLFLRKLSAEKPVGEWNTMEVACKADQIVVSLNGIVVNEGNDLAKRAGRICLLSQNTQLEFRNIKLKSQ